jgi:hypothetical protein
VARNSKTKPTAPTRTEDLINLSLDQIATILLRAGLDSPTAEWLLRRAFVKASVRTAGTKNRHPTQSQIASFAGISRLDVRKILAETSPSLGKLAKPTSRLDGLLQGWCRDGRFSTKAGKPRDLEFRGPNSEFDELVREYGRDITKRTLKVQLVRLGFAQIRNGKLSLRSRKPKTQRGLAASADLRFVASQLANIDFELGRRAYSSRHISITADARKSVYALRTIAISRLETVLSSLESMSSDRRRISISGRANTHRLLVSTTVAVESEEPQ